MKKLYIIWILLSFLFIYWCSTQKISGYDYLEEINNIWKSCWNTWNSIDFENIEKSEIISKFDQVMLVCNDSLWKLDELWDFEWDDTLYNAARKLIISYLDFIDFFNFKLKNPSTSESENDIVRSELENMYDNVFSLQDDYIKTEYLFEKNYIFDYQEYIDKYWKYYWVSRWINSQ